MFGGGRGPRRANRFLDGPVAIPRGERVNLRRESSESGYTSSGATSTVTAKLPSPQAAAANPAWFGQTYEYAAGVALREHVLEPTLQELQQNNDNSIEDDDYLTTSEPARLLSYFAKGQVVLMAGGSGAVHVGSIGRVTGHDGLTLISWWDVDKTLVYTGGRDDWSDWWVNRCNLFDPGCEMIKLKTSDNRTLGLAYFERNVAHEGQRLTLIRGIRVDPALNEEAIRRASTDRVAGLNAELTIEFPGVAAALLHHVLFTSMHFGTQGVAVNCPKDDATEDFYQHFMGLPESISPSDGRRFFRVDAKERFVLLRSAFSQQIDFMLLLRDRLRPQTEEVLKAGDNAAPQVPGANKAAPLVPVVDTQGISDQQAEDVPESDGEEEPEKDNLIIKAKESEVADSDAVASQMEGSEEPVSPDELTANENEGNSPGADEAATPEAASGEETLKCETGAETAVAENHDSTVGSKISEPPKSKANETVNAQSCEPEARKDTIEMGIGDKANHAKFSVEAVGALTKRALESAANLQGASRKKPKLEEAPEALEEGGCQEDEGNIFDDPDD